MTTATPYVELGFIADDRPGLLAMITATLAAARFKVISAQVYSWVDSFGRTRALDLFWVRAGETTDSVTGSLARLDRDFNRLLSMEAFAFGAGHWRRAGARACPTRPTPKVPTEVNIDNRCATDHSVIEVTTKDQQGLLFWLANTLQHLDLQTLAGQDQHRGHPGGRRVLRHRYQRRENHLDRAHGRDQGAYLVEHRPPREGIQYMNFAPRMASPVSHLTRFAVFVERARVRACGGSAPPPEAPPPSLEDSRAARSGRAQRQALEQEGGARHRCHQSAGLCQSQSAAQRGAQGEPEGPASGLLFGGSSGRIVRRDGSYGGLQGCPSRWTRS